MPTLTAHKDFQDARRIPFCYLCGHRFVDGDRKNDDHIPPKSCFAKTDRNVPLKLPTHVTCNHSYHLVDEKICQVLSLKRGVVPKARNRRVAMEVFPPSRQHSVLGAITNVDIKGAVRRWVRGFHAALYGEPLPESPNFSINTPFPTASRSSGRLRFDPLLPQHSLFVQTIKVNRFAKNLDRINSNNGELTYECIWVRSDSGPWLCIFALNIYDWKDMGAVQNFPARGCVGCYITATGEPPAGATQATSLQVVVPNYEPLDPFGR